MTKDPQVTLLFDFYGEMLTDKQRDMIEQYYNQDLSLSEIAENVGISRQGVRDSVKRAETQLFDMEERLGLCELLQHTRCVLTAIAAEAGDLRRELAHTAGSERMVQRADRIAALADGLAV